MVGSIGIVNKLQKREDEVEQYENKLLDLRNQGQTYKEIADRIGFSKK